jgi:hypothetical protein
MMLTRGMFHAVTAQDLRELRRAKDGPQRRQLIQEWDERWPDEWRCSTDKSWKFISIALSFQEGAAKRNPQSGLGLGFDLFYEKRLHRAEFYLITLISHEWLVEIVPALEAFDELSYRNLYHSEQVQAEFESHRFRANHGIDPADDQRREYSWRWLQRIRDLLRKALDGGRSAIFSAENC